MAEATGLRNNALPYPVYGVPYGLSFPIIDADGDFTTGATGLDSEVSKNGDTFADCTNEATEIATASGIYYLLLTAAEMTADVVSIIVKTTSSGAKTTVLTLYPRKLVALRSGTAQGGAPGYITLDASAGSRDDRWNGCLCVATIDTLVEARIINDYTGSNQQAAVTPNWNVTPDSDDTFILYLPEGMQSPTVNTSHISEQSQTTRDIGANVVADLQYILGTGLTETSGSNLGNAFKKFFDKSSPTGTINSIPDAVAGANNGLATVDANNAVKIQTGTAMGQLDFTSGILKVDLHTIKTQTVNCAAAVTIYPAVGMTATANGNFEIVFATDFATNYNTTNDQWNVSASAGGVSEATLAKYVGLIVRNDAAIQTDLAAEIALINTDYTSGVGSYDSATMSLQHTAPVIVQLGVDSTGAYGFEESYLNAERSSGHLISTLIDTVTSQTVFTLSAGSADDDAYPAGSLVIINDGGGINKAVGYVSNYVGSTKEVTLASDPDGYTFAVGNQVDIIAVPSSAGGGLDAAGVRAAIGMASANLDTQLGAIQTTVDDLPTNSELGTALSGLATTTQLTTVEGKVDTVDTVADAIKTKTDNLPTDPADQSLIIAATNAVMLRLGDPAGASVSADVAAVKTDTGNLATRVTANLFSGITYMKNWLGIIAGKTADAPTLAEINATTAGSTYTNSTNSLEAQADTGSGGITLNATELANFKYILNQITSGLVATDAANTAKIFKTDRTGISLVGQVCFFASGAAAANARIPHRVIAHDTATGVIQVDVAFPAIPTVGDVILFTGYQSSIT